MARRWRAFAYGLAAALVAAGAICAAVVSGVTGEVLALVFLGTGLLGAVLLSFLRWGSARIAHAPGARSAGARGKASPRSPDDAVRGRGGHAARADEGTIGPPAVRWRRPGV